VALLLSMLHMQVTTHLLRIMDGDQTPDTTSQGPTVDVFCIDAGRSQTSGTASKGATVDVFCVDGGCSRTSGTASQGARRRHFLR
jgi:hypothetical protein